MRCCFCSMTFRLRFVLNQSDAQTEDGHAMKKLDTCHSFWNLSHAVRGCHNNCRKWQRMSQLSAEKSALMLDQLMCTRRQRPERKWQVDCESAVRSCMSSVCEKVLSDGSWAGLSCVVSSIRLLKISDLDVIV